MWVWGASVSPNEQSFIRSMVILGPPVNKLTDRHLTFPQQRLSGGTVSINKLIVIPVTIHKRMVSVKCSQYVLINQWSKYGSTSRLYT